MFKQFATNGLPTPISREEFATNRRIMDSFIGIRFKKETAKRFQEFSRTHFKSHTEALETMLEFFFYNEISPHEKLGPTGRTIEASFKKRINAVIAIMRDMEKTQTKPTAAMIASLFQTEAPPKKPLILEKKILREKKDGIPKQEQDGRGEKNFSDNNL